MTKLSLFASAVRSHIWKDFLESVKNVPGIEVIFGGPCTPEEVKYFLRYPFFTYLHTGDIKPGQVYEACRRECQGELVHWTADDAEYNGKILQIALGYWNLIKYENHKILISLQTVENGTLFDMKLHSFLGGRPETPTMAPLGIMDREYLDQLGGLDQRYIAGQYENDIAMRVFADGGVVKIIGDVNNFVDLAHERKHSTSTKFWSAFGDDRKTLESSWSRNGKPSHNRVDSFLPYPTDLSLQVSIEPKGIWK